MGRGNDLFGGYASDLGDALHRIAIHFAPEGRPHGLAGDLMAAGQDDLALAVEQRLDPAVSEGLRLHVPHDAGLGMVVPDDKVLRRTAFNQFAFAQQLASVGADQMRAHWSNA